MGTSTSSKLTLLSLLLLSVPWETSNSAHESFLQCMHLHSTSYSPNSQLLHTPNTSSYSYLLKFSLQNLRFLSPKTLKPLFIITPFQVSEIQAAIHCSRKNGLQIRVRSGGHDYEGLSYLSDVPFIIVDLVNLRSVTVDVDDETAWVQAGATLGELHHEIAEKSKIHGFPAGVCHTVGVGGHLSGGGLGTLMRKYGLSADNIVDAYLVDVKGRILDRKSMGEALFWAIRGGGGASFGVILSWKIKLVRVPPIVTVFRITRTLEEGATKLVHRWQYIADKLPEDLFIEIIIQVGDREGQGEKTIQAIFNSLFLGSIDQLIQLMNDSFPELGLQNKDCNEMTWIESVLHFAGYSDSRDVLLDRKYRDKSFLKAKSDFVKEPIPEIGLEGMWEKILEEKGAFMIMDPCGGRMREISESEIPFPHRDNLYNILYLVKWNEKGIKEAKKHIHWIRKLYRYMSPYVSNSPRAAYLNYRDLDLGRNEPAGNTSYSEAKVWGRKYFKNNFKRLAYVKSVVDPNNFFRNEQSIPPLPAKKIRENEVGELAWFGSPPSYWLSY